MRVTCVLLILLNHIPSMAITYSADVGLEIACKGQLFPDNYCVDSVNEGKLDKHNSSGVHTRTLNFEVILTTTVPKGIKPGVFVRVDNVAVIKLEDNCKF